VKAAEILQKEGINALVVNSRFVKPFDSDLFKQISKLTSKIVTVEENALMAGFGSAVMEFYQQEGILSSLQIKCLGIPDQFYEQASVSKLYQLAGIDIPSIAKAARELVGTEQAKVASTGF
jgi:1-deoxy-D-xylulose-5-phosphate synthase